MKISDIHVGDKVLVGRFFGEKPRDGDFLYSQATVVKVGRKYVTISTAYGLERRFELYYTDGNADACPYALMEHTERPIAYLMWPSERAFERYCSYVELRNWAKSEFGTRYLTYNEEQLTAIRQALQNCREPLYPELDTLGYRDDGNGPSVTLPNSFGEDVRADENFGTYLVTVDIPGRGRHYCYANGRSKYEAIGVFIDHHPNVNGSMIVACEQA